jgi:hypothetical protein
LLNPWERTKVTGRIITAEITENKTGFWPAHILGRVNLKIIKKE